VPPSIFRTKPLAGLYDEAAEGGDFALRRRLGVADLVLMGVGATFARHAGPAVVVSIAIAALVSLLAALCYAELASMVPVAGSAYTYSYAAWGELPAFVVGWNQVLATGAAAATLAIGCSAYLVSLFGRVGIRLSPVGAGAGPGGGVNVSAALVILLVSLLLVFGIRESSRGFAGLVPLKLLVAVFGFVVPGLFLIRTDHLSPLVPGNTGRFGEFGWSGVWVGAGLLFFLYLGAEAVGAAAEEARHPQADISRGLGAGQAVTTALYVVLGLMLLGTAGYARLGVPNPFSVALNAAGFGKLPAMVLEAGIVASILSAIAYVLLGLHRLAYGISRDGLLPAVFSRLHPRYRTPHLTVAAFGVLSALAAALVPLGTAARLASLTLLVNFAVLCAGVFLLRGVAPERPRPFRVPGGRLGAAAGAAGCAGLALALVMYDATQGLLLLGWLLLGMATYAAFGYRASRLASGRMRA
jgi:APA family basic amino acid/polyamine antiporter